jgi:hypothetical protein
MIKNKQSLKRKNRIRQACYHISATICKKSDTRKRKGWMRLEMATFV